MVKKQFASVCFCLGICLPILAEEDVIFAALKSPAASYKDKMSALKQAGHYEAALLMDVLLDRSACSGLTEAQERSYLNEVMNHLREFDDPERDLAKTLVLLARDHERDPAVREYAIQHLGLVYNKSGSRHFILESLMELATDERLATASLLQLHHLRRSGVAVDDGTYSALVITASGRESMRMADQLTLLSIIGDEKNGDSLPAVKKWAATASYPLVVLGAIDVIRRLGAPGDAHFLDQEVATRNLSYANQSIERAKREIISRSD